MHAMQVASAAGQAGTSWAGGSAHQSIALPFHHAPVQTLPCLLQGVETLGQLVQSGLGFLLTALKQDPNAHVKDTTAWTIGVLALLGRPTVGLAAACACCC